MFRHPIVTLSAIFNLIIATATLQYDKGEAC